MTDKTIDALKLAEEALRFYVEDFDCAAADVIALAAIREVLAEQTQLQQAKEMLLAVDDVVRQSLSDIEALAEQDDFAASGKPMDHIAASGKVIAEPLQILPGGGAFPFVEVGYVGEFVAPTKSLPAGTPLCVAPVQPVKHEPRKTGGLVGWHLINENGKQNAE